MLIHYLYILTFEFLCSGINFDPSGLVTFWFSEGQLLRPLVLLFFISSKRQLLDKAHNDIGFFRAVGDLNCQDLAVAMVVIVKKLY